MHGMEYIKTHSANLIHVSKITLNFVSEALRCLLKSSLIITSYLFMMWLLFYDAHAQTTLPTFSNSKTLVNYNIGYTLKDTRFSLSRLTIDWSGKLKLSSSWNAQIELSAELADDDVGLGSSRSFAHFNKLVIDENHVRLDISQLLLTWRQGINTLDIGKQIIPWGVLDGVQVSDRFDPVRRRDFVFAEHKPERLARWGVRWRTKLNTWRIDSAFVFDGTVSQQANLADEFQLTAPRYLAGLNLSQLGDDIRLTLHNDERNHSLSQSTLGMRISRNIGSGELSLLGFRGPDTEPVLSVTPL